jgi:NAD(P)-dependent dehydrogenase (short-subunit alcohol dehydrogenase family)
MQVAICARNPEGVERTAREIGPNGDVLWAAVDVSDHAAVAKWVGERRNGSAGWTWWCRMRVRSQASHTRWKAVASTSKVDVMSAVTLVDAAVPFLRRSDSGSIVQIGTITAVENHYYPGGGPSYGPMKTALVNYISQLAKELRSDGIRANAVSPGPIYIDGGSWDRIRQKERNTTKPTRRDIRRVGSVGPTRSRTWWRSPPALGPRGSMDRIWSWMARSRCVLAIKAGDHA